MTTPSVPAPDSSGFTVADASLHRLAELINESQRRDDVAEPTLIRIVLVDSGFEVGFRSLDGLHPSVWLMGFDAPADWDAVGVMASGRTFSPDDLTTTLGRAQITTIVSRRGEIASSLSVEGGEHVPGPAEGLVVDLLQRSLRLPTAPAPCESTVYFAACWLSEVVTTIDRDGHTPTWDEIVWLHPAMSMLRDDDDVGAGDFVEVHRAFGRVATWARLRRMVDDGTFTVEGLEPGDGAWFDDGGFARQVLSNIPPFRAIRTRVREVLPTGLSRRMSATLRALDIPTAVWPDVASKAA